VNRLKPAVEDDSDSPFVLKEAGMMFGGNARWIDIGVVLGAMLISNRRPYFWPTRKSS